MVKIFKELFSSTQSPMVLKLRYIATFWTQAKLKFIYMMILGCLWPILRQYQKWMHMHLNGKNCNKVIYWGKLAANGKYWHKVYVMQKIDPRGCMPPAPRLCTCIGPYLKQFEVRWNLLTNQSQIVCAASVQRGTWIYKNGLAQMTMIAAMAKYGIIIFLKSCSSERGVWWSWTGGGGLK